MKTIIFTVTNDLNNDQRMQKICNSLHGAGYDVLLAGRKRKKSAPLRPQAFRQKRLICWFQKGKLFYIEYNIRLFIFLLFQKADILCAIDLDTIVPVALAGRLRNRKKVYDAHEYFTEVPELMHRPRVQQIWKWVERKFVPQMDSCYTVSQSLAALYKEKYRKTFDVILNAPLLKDHADAHPIPNADEMGRFILYQGALNKGRGLETLIECMKQLPLKLVIAGDGDLAEGLKKQVKDADLENKVIFLGMLSPAELEILTPQAWLGYNLLENLGASYYYSLSNKFFDYIHACLPGISNRFPEYSAIVCQYNCGILTNLSIPDIVLSVERTINDAAYYQQIRESCKIAREIFNWQAQEQKLINIYNALV